ncbi:MAG TPA: ATP-binding protein, partial [Roseivirga sp.]
NYAFNEINQVLKELSREKASNLLYLQTIVEHVRVAVICFDKTYKVKLFNQAARTLFGKKQTTSIKTLQSISPVIAKAVLEMGNGERELIKVNLNGQVFNLSMLVTEFRLKDEDYKLVSFQDIKSELEAKEIESWQKLIRVLTHEIKNSVIPISTLSEVLLQMLKTDDGGTDLAKLDQESIEDIIGGIETIEKRSKALAHFVSTYDQLTKIPQPKLKPSNLKQLINNTLKLFSADIEKHGILIQSDLSDLTINIDPTLIEQVIINLLKNAIEALAKKEDAAISIALKQENSEIHLSIHDNGMGIPDEILDNIFVPFYTTKKGGSGIGLSLSRQIMRLHKGHLLVETSRTGTVFRLVFPISVPINA